MYAFKITPPPPIRFHMLFKGPPLPPMLRTYFMDGPYFKSDPDVKLCPSFGDP